MSHQGISFDKLILWYIAVKVAVCIKDLKV